MQQITNSQTTVVTGAAGFIGAYLVRCLLDRGVPGNQILAVDTPAFFDERRCSRAFKAAGVRTMAPDDFIKELSGGDVKAQIIYHMGACSSTDETREDYLREVNLDYSKKLWALGVKLGIPLLYASSAATYGGGEQGFSDDPQKIPLLRPLNLYGWSKQRFDLFALEEAQKGLTPPFWAGFKFFNVYGPGEDHKGRQASVALHARRQFTEKGFVKLFKSHRAGVGDGEQKRDFVWVGDIADALFEFAKGRMKGGIYNLGSGQARSFLDLAKASAAALGLPFRAEFIETPEALREHYQYFTEADLTNLRAAGYTKPFTSLETGVKRYFEEWSSGQ